jgi:serine/threonine protein kinase
MFTLLFSISLTCPNSEVQRLNPTIAQERGYSSAVDMWSVGTVTALMLTGNLAFDHRGSDGEVGQIKSRSRSAYDISTIDQGDYYWEMIAKRARSFVTSLLVLQEDQRLTAKQALEHSWFTHHICAHSFDAVYERSVREWKPRSTSEQDIVVHIDTSDIAIPTPSLSQVVCQPTASSVVQSAFFKGQNNSDQVDMSTNVEEVTEQRLDNTSQLAASPAYPLDARRETFSPNHPPPQSSNPKEDLDRMRPSAQLMNPSIELSWPSSPPNGRGRKRLPSSELPWPTQ